MKRILLILILSLPLLSFGKVRLKVACIDCYSTASLMPAYTRDLDPEVEIEWILVQTHAYKPHHLSGFLGFPENSRRLEAFELEKAENLDRLVATLTELGVDHVVGGMDEGTYQACAINDRLGAKFRERDNPIGSREIRNKKSLAGKAVGEYGIDTLVLTEDLGAALKFIDGFPQQEVVVKWDSGAGGVDMLFLDKSDRQGLVSALREKSHTESRPFHGRKDQILLQPKIDIEREFYINTFSYNGETVITGLWEYFKVKIGRYTVYFVDRPLPLTGPEAKALRPIASRINRDMEKRNGMSHMEVGVERGSGRVYLIENNTRVVGTGITSIERKLWGMSQLDLFLLSLFDKERMLREMAAFRDGKPMNGDAILFMVPSPMAGVLTEYGVDTLTNLASYQKLGPQYLLNPNTATKQTQDLHTAAAVVRLYGEAAQVRADFETAFTTLINNQLIASSASLNCAVEIAAHEDFFAPFKKRKNQIQWNYNAGI